MDAGEKRRIGSTKLNVSQMGFGAAPLGNLFAALSEADAFATIQTALAAGIRYFDTAPFYGHGLSEHRLGAALRRVPRDDYVLSTKVGRLLVPGESHDLVDEQFHQPLPFDAVYDYSYDGVMRSFEDSLQRLGLSRIDILLIHDVDVWTHGTREAADARMEEIMQGGYRAMVKLRDEGVIGAIGAGLNEWQACQRFAERGDFDCFLLASRYTLLEQTALETFLPLCQARNISVIIGGPFNTGILATGAVEGAFYDYNAAPPEILARVRAIEAVCARHGVALPAAALQFPLHHPAVAAIIPGARAVDEVTRNGATLGADIPTALWTELKAEGLIQAGAPTP
jgi:D-threo-aldose 1-dehydrogenase